MNAVFVVLLASCGAVTALLVYAFERLRTAMSSVYPLSGGIAELILVYLVVALLYPEKF